MSKSDRGLVFGVDLGKSGNGLAGIDYENKNFQVDALRLQRIELANHLPKLDEKRDLLDDSLKESQQEKSKL